MCLGHSVTRIAVNLTHTLIVVLKGAAGGVGLPGPEGTEGPKVCHVAAQLMHAQCIFLIETGFTNYKNNKITVTVMNRLVCSEILQRKWKLRGLGSGCSKISVFNFMKEVQEEPLFVRGRKETIKLITMMIFKIENVQFKFLTASLPSIYFN